MKTKVSKFNTGQQVEAKISEVLSNGDLIAVFQGDLLRVKNQTQKTFRVGEHIVLEVSAVRPLSFRLATTQRGMRFRATV